MTKNPHSISVIVATFHRPNQLRNCLEGLARQTLWPCEILVVWQADDCESDQIATVAAMKTGLPIRRVHCQEVGIVSAENAGLAAAIGEFVALTDDDAVPHPDWLARLAKLFDDPVVGAAGGSIVNYSADGSPMPIKVPLGPTQRIGWFGRLYGNGHDLPPEVRQRPVETVDHLSGANFAFRRSLLTGFESRLRPYWQYFELDACCKIRHRGYFIRYDYGCIVDHYPTANAAFVPGRSGDLNVTVFNAAYNMAFVLAKHSPWLQRPARLIYLLLVGNAQVPGLLGALLAWRRFGNFRRELGVLWKTWGATLAGWAAGRRAAGASG